MQFKKVFQNFKSVYYIRLTLLQGSVDFSKSKTKIIIFNLKIFIIIS